MFHLPVTVMPWHFPDPCMPPKMQTPAAFNPSFLEYQASLSLESKLLASPLTSIMCTIGTSCNVEEVLMDLMDGGMSVALVQMASSSREEVQDTVKLLQSAVTANSAVHNRVIPLAIAVQLKPPGVHIGCLDKSSIRLEAGEMITMTTNHDWKYRGNSHICYFDLPNAMDMLNTGDLLLLDTGSVKLKVDSVFAGERKVACRVESGGQLTSNMKVSIPGVPLCLGTITEQDIDDLQFISDMSSVDIVIVPDVKYALHVHQVKAILEENNSEGVIVYSRIECKTGIENILEIARESDGIVLARNELASEIEATKLLVVQKIICSVCNKIGKPVYICANYMESVESDPVPSFAEIIDLQSALLDGADGIVLENATARSSFPTDVLKAASNACREAEAAVWQSQIFNSLLGQALPPIDPTHAISISAVEASLKSCAAAIVVATTSGRSAQLVARYRPRCHIIAISRYGQVARQLSSWRAVIPIHCISPPLSDWNKEVDVRLQMGIELGKEKGLIKSGDPVVLLNCWRRGAGFTNTLRVVYASDSDPWVFPNNLTANVDFVDQRIANHATSYSLFEGCANLYTDRATSSYGNENEDRATSYKYESPSIHSKNTGNLSTYETFCDQINDQKMIMGSKKYSNTSNKSGELGVGDQGANETLGMETTLRESAFWNEEKVIGESMTALKGESGRVSATQRPSNEEKGRSPRGSQRRGSKANNA